MSIKPQYVLNSQEMIARQNSYDAMGHQLAMNATTHDGRFVDSTGAFLVGELTRFDLTAHMPLFRTTYMRDMPIRTDVTLGDQETAFTQSSFTAAGGPGTGAPIGQKRSFMGMVTTQIPGVAVDIGATTLPLVPWGLEAAYSLAELQSSIQLGRPIDQQKMMVIDNEFELQSDAQAYLGWQGNSTYGLVNNVASVTPQNLPNGVSGFSQWAKKTGTEILIDLSNMVYGPWAATGFSAFPNRIGLPPQDLALISSLQVAVGGAGGTSSVLKFFMDSNIASNSGVDLRIVDLKWLIGAGGAGGASGATQGIPGTVGNAAGSLDRACVWTYVDDWQQAPVRFPKTALNRTPINYDGYWHKFFKWARMGACEFVYPETVAYYDGI